MEHARTSASTTRLIFARIRRRILMEKKIPVVISFELARTFQFENKICLLPSFLIGQYYLSGGRVKGHPGYRHQDDGEYDILPQREPPAKQCISSSAPNKKGGKQ
ncbi:uncharacterized protein LOC143188280 [Calliopsis andreniformis]|uniref:uncharacterized protein LOC143188280 n=1 Tax=Calliopsis andreniformis TaxID=337506 RepID=UPI003FCEAFAE